ncbi:hypothetical protein [Streptomyces sp. BK205]|uniref:hypothetical protein n=1 Tax=Streptomyces sp. BK205 TaxID=2512164 RepID=UPI00104E9F3F|nr:hypothetical protein [Streptomyces sp. BK205]TCR20316.1 hypothetical protein EV578_107257 [Streptomyces sp. BK205]
MSPAPVRFHDPGSTAYDFCRSALVRCPRCDRIAHFERTGRWRTSAPGEGAARPESRVICRSCGLARTMNGCCRPPLWLRAGTRHGELWAYDLTHLDLIRRFVAASLRERDPWYEHGRKMTLVARLPVWVKRARNRDEVLRTIDRMRASVTAR